MCVSWVFTTVLCVYTPYKRDILFRGILLRKLHTVCVHYYGAGVAIKEVFSLCSSHFACYYSQNKPSSDSGMFEGREELDNYEWFWGDMNRVDSEARIKEEGEVGNFAIRVNANGHFVMTFWLVLYHIVCVCVCVCVCMSERERECVCVHVCVCVCVSE